MRIAFVFFNEADEEQDGGQHGAKDDQSDVEAGLDSRPVNLCYVGTSMGLWDSSN